MRKLIKLLQTFGVATVMISGSFAAMAVEQRNYCGTTCVSHQETLHFNSGKTAVLDMTSSKRAILKKMEDKIKKQKNSGLAACVAGHADSDGGEAANSRLSLNRARVVGGQLRSFGLAKGIPVKLQGHGEGLPIATNATPIGKARNRRVVVQYGYNKTAGGKCITSGIGERVAQKGGLSNGKKVLLGLLAAGAIAALLNDDDDTTTTTPTTGSTN